MTPSSLVTAAGRRELPSTKEDTVSGAKVKGSTLDVLFGTCLL